MPIELGPNATALLRGPNIAHLASVRPDGAPMVHPVWVGLDDEGHVLVCTGRHTPKVRNAEHDPRVALSITGQDDPYDELMLRGIVIAVRNDDDLADMDRISITYTGRPFPFRSGARVTIVIEPTWAEHRTLPFEHTPGDPAAAGGPGAGPSA